LSTVISDKPFCETEWQSFVGTSHFYLTKNESNFIFRVKTQAVRRDCAALSVS